MAIITLLAGAALTLLGLVCFLLSDSDKAATALIPSVAGVLIAICGAVMLTGKLRALMAHLALGVALLLLIAIGGRWAGAGIPSMAEQPLVFWDQVGAVLISLAFLLAGVNSFVKARRARAVARE